MARRAFSSTSSSERGRSGGRATCAAPAAAAASRQAVRGGGRAGAVEPLFMKNQPPPAAASTATTMPIIIDRRLAGLLFAARAAARGAVTALSASAVEEMRAASLTARSIAAGFDRRVDQRLDGAFEHQGIDHAGRGGIANRDDDGVVRAGGDRREVFGIHAAQVGDQDRARARLEHGGGGGEAVRVAQRQVDSSMGPSCAHKSRSGVAMSASGFFDLNELAPGLLPPGCGDHCARSRQIQNVLAWTLDLSSN